METLIIIIIGIFGLIIGSFLNVVILRMNTGKGIGGRSMCFSCRKTLKWYELIPVFSWIIQKGKCRSCKSKISPQYPLVEASTALLFTGIAARFDFFLQPVTLILWLVLVSIGMVIAVYDIRHRVIAIKPLILFFAITVALGMHILAAIFIPLPFLVLWIISQGKWIGFGDIELMGCMGMLLGITAGISAVVISFWIACAVILPWYAVKRMRNKKHSHEVPFGPFLLFGIYVVVIGQMDILGMLIHMVR
jgi:prepilin signal peptidase PulO-like enzyme (type II secretory pathway)